MQKSKALILGIITAFTIGMSSPESASAHGWHRGWGWGGAAVGLGLGLATAGALAAPYYYPGYAYGYGYPRYYGYGYGCHLQRVWGPYGWHFVRVCG
jgi:hypothetical protein